MTQYGSPAAPHRGDGPRAAALAGLVARGVITAQQADAVHDALDTAERGHTGARWAEIVGYVGGGLVFSGVLALIGLSWADLSRAGQVGVLAAVGAVLLAGGLAAAGGPKAVRGRSHRVPTARRRITGVLWALTAVAVMAAVGVAAEERTGTLLLSVGLLAAAAAYAALPSAVGLVTCGLLAPALVMAAADLSGVRDDLATALLVVVLGALWCGIAATGLLVHRRLGYGLGAATALIGAQYSAFDGSYATGYTLSFLIAAALLALYQWDRQVVLLVGGVLGLTTAVPQAVWDLTDGAIGGAAALLIAGLVLLLTSGLGLRLHRAGEHARAARTDGPGTGDAPGAPPAGGAPPHPGTPPHPGGTAPPADGATPPGGAAPPASGDGSPGPDGGAPGTER